MKRKSIIVILAILMCISLSACGGNNSSNTETTSDKEAAEKANSEQEAEDKVELIDMKTGETIKTDEFELTLESIEFSYKEESSDLSSYHDVYNAESGQVFVIIRGNYKNISNRDHLVSDLPNIVVTYKDEYNYMGKGMIDDGTHFLHYSGNVAATPLQTSQYFALADCPEEVKTGDGSVVVYLSDGKSMYQYKLK